MDPLKKTMHYGPHKVTDCNDCPVCVACEATLLFYCALAERDINEDRPTWCPLREYNVYLESVKP